jgi:hypothetical protein
MVIVQTLYPDNTRAIEFLEEIIQEMRSGKAYIHDLNYRGTLSKRFARVEIELDFYE